LLRRGAAFVAVSADGSVLMRSRPPKGLLGGMTEVADHAMDRRIRRRDGVAPSPSLLRAKPKWRRIPGTVSHVFTHFPLELVVFRAEIPAGTRPPAGARWIALADLHGEALART